MVRLQRLEIVGLLRVQVDRHHHQDQAEDDERGHHKQLQIGHCQVKEESKYPEITHFKI